ncbi:MAG: hypothetical protein GQ565_11160 [Candidatus Aegiribacteria sp.]|nr:hypothetical protein [Candidatus Aegiribacteria sp.]
MLDIIVGGHDGMIDHYRAVDSGVSYPVLTYAGHITANSTVIDVGYNAAPVVVDWNEDGLLDMLVEDEGNIGGSAACVRMYINRGSTGNPIFEDYTFINCGGTPITTRRGFPDVADLNRDGRKDLIIGETGGYLQYYENTGTNESPLFDSVDSLKYNNGSSTIFLLAYARTYVTDWNDDGCLDLLCGNGHGYVILFEGSQVGIEKPENSAGDNFSFSVIDTPSCGSITVRLGLEERSNAKLSVYDITGRQVVDLHLGEIDPGDRTFYVGMNSQPAGVYYIVCKIGSHNITANAVLL